MQNPIFVLVMDWMPFLTLRPFENGDKVALPPGPSHEKRCFTRSRFNGEDLKIAESDVAGVFYCADMTGCTAFAHSFELRVRFVISPSEF